MNKEMSLEREFQVLIEEICESIIDEVVMNELKKSELKIESSATYINKLGNRLEDSNTDLKKTVDALKDKLESLHSLNKKMVASGGKINKGLEDNRKAIVNDMIGVISQYNKKMGEMSDAHQQLIKKSLISLSSIEQKLDEHNSDTLEGIGLVYKEILDEKDPSKNRFDLLEDKVKMLDEMNRDQSEQLKRIRLIVVIALVFGLLNTGLLVGALYFMR